MGEHQKCEQRADEHGIIGRERLVDAKRISAGDSEPLQRTNACLDRRGDKALSFLQLGNTGNVHIPNLPLAIFERERLDGPHPLQSLDQEGSARAFGVLNQAGHFTEFGQA